MHLWELACQRWFACGGARLPPPIASRLAPPAEAKLLKTLALSNACVELKELQLVLAHQSEDTAKKSSGWTS
jgi:hypothetical protein